MRTPCCRHESHPPSANQIGLLTVPVCDLTSYLTGKWVIIRRIVDKRTGYISRVIGDATFTSFLGGLRYDECGMLDHGRFRGEATQTYWFLIEHHSAEADVRFGDNRPFHTLDLSSGKANVKHVCGYDYYWGRYHLGCRNSWILSWKIEGPRKEMLIGTRYIRL